MYSQILKTSLVLLVSIFVNFFANLTAFAGSTPSQEITKKVLASNPTEHGLAVIYHTDDVWADVNEFIKNEIVNRGIVISYTSHASDLLDRTAKDIGIKHTTYKNAEIHLFCKVNISHEMVKHNPHVIAGCPYGIAVYELQSQPGITFVSYRKPPSLKKAPEYEKVAKLLKDIIETVLF